MRKCLVRLLQTLALIFIGALFPLNSAAQQLPPQQLPPGLVADPSAPITLSISPVDNPVKSGSPVKFKAITVNKSDHNVEISREVTLEDRAGFNYYFDIRDQRSGVPPKTKWARPPEGSIVYITLKPKEQLIDIINASKLYDLHQPGKYNVQLTTFDVESHSLVKSNVVTITVTP